MKIITYISVINIFEQPIMMALLIENVRNSVSIVVDVKTTCTLQRKPVIIVAM